MLVAAATGAGSDGLRRAEELINAGADVIVVDTAHGHSEVLKTVAAVRKLADHVQIVGGNVATSEGAKALIDSGADAVKVGIGPGQLHHTNGCRCWRASVDRDNGCRRSMPQTKYSGYC